MPYIKRGESIKGSRMGTDRNLRANTRHLTRILVILKGEKKGICYKIIRNRFVGNARIIGDALRWLENHGLITRKKLKSSPLVIYKLK